MERRGSGLRKIIEAYEVEENYKEELKPVFKSTESSFTTILKNLNYDTQNDTQNDGKKLKPNYRRNKIVKLIKENSKITSLDLSSILYVSVSTIKRDLKVLTDEKTIEYIGSTKDEYWKVNK